MEKKKDLRKENRLWDGGSEIYERNINIYEGRD